MNVNVRDFGQLVPQMKPHELQIALHQLDQEQQQIMLTILSCDGPLCGIPLEKLTVSQMILRNKYKNDPTAMQVLERIQYNEEEGQYEFIDIGWALSDSAVAEGVDTKSAQESIDKLGGSREIPRDFTFEGQKDPQRLELHPSQSTYDAMIQCMPGHTDVEKIENFRLLTGMDGEYITAQSYGVGTFVARRFTDYRRHRFIGQENYENGSMLLRPVRALPVVN